uniref:Phage integrase family protein n=1 Tax=Psychrobacter sp. (strain PRwf-1) TaxID=349106 RepID=A5WEI3_PSYWF
MKKTNSLVDTNSLTNLTDQAECHKLVSFEGYEFDYADERWPISRSASVIFYDISDILDPFLFDNYKKVLLHYVENNSGGYADAINSYTRDFFKFCYQQDKVVLSGLSSKHFINFYSSLPSTKKSIFGQISPFFKKWLEFGYEGIDNNALEAFNEVRIKGTIKGKAVRTLCPYEGPLSDLEYEGFYNGLNREFEKGSISLEEMVLVSLLLATGRRVTQIAHLKVKDYIGTTTVDGNEFHLLRIPKIKQRALWRDGFSDYALSPELGGLVEAQIDSMKSKLESLGALNQIDFEMLPILPYWKKIDELVANNAFTELNELLNSDRLHLSSFMVGSRLKKTASKVGLISERTGELINIFATRFRRTLASRAAREGYGVLIIARLLDHTDTQNALVYTENSPEHLKNIDKAMALQLAPIAQAFSGTLVKQEKDAKRGDDISSRIRNRETDEAVGTCGTHSFCAALSPIACYTCHHFQPWLDGPHEAVLNNLIEQRKNVLQKTNDLTIASVNDRVIFAVSEVIKLCETQKSTLSFKGGK